MYYIIDIIVLYLIYIYISLYIERYTRLSDYTTIEITLRGKNLCAALSCT